MSKSSVRIRLWKKDQHCYWCRRPTRLIVPADHETLPDDMATVDHLFSKLDEKRHQLEHGIIKRGRNGSLITVRRVLSCYACNHERGRMECKLTLAKEQATATANGAIAAAPHQMRGKLKLHECGYPERKWRLGWLRRRAEKDLSGLITVMGLPLKGGIQTLQEHI